MTTSVSGSGGVSTGTPGLTPQSRFGQTTPVLAPSARDTPSTAAVARRLDNSYGPPPVVGLL